MKNLTPTQAMNAVKQMKKIRLDVEDGYIDFFIESNGKPTSLVVTEEGTKEFMADSIGKMRKVFNTPGIKGHMYIVPEVLD
ncbi:MULTISPECIES: hypothetical protein [Bacillus]|uniref:hypothetical protein n=1 Tax=Bacillus TaxID=1386 RepID=UPI00031D0CA4|nr:MULTISPECIES: hypothetical protein [Bacillus]